MSGRTLLITVIAVAALALTLAGPAVAQEEAPSVGQLFIEAFDKKDEAAMKELVKTRAAEVPQEVKDMVEYAMSPGASRGEQDYLFNIAGAMSTMYGEATGDERLLGAVRASYQNLLEKRESGALPPAGVAAAKKELLALGNGDWRIRTFKLDQKGDLLIDVDVKEASGGSFTPNIDFKQSNQAKEIVKKNLPNIKKGKISWSSMGIGLKTAFID